MASFSHVAAVAALTVAAATAQGAAQPARTAGASTASAATSAPIGDVRYEITFDSLTARTKTLRVRMSFAVRGEGPVLLSLPSWTPGAYEITNFARWVSEFSATAGEKPLDWDKLDPDTWRIDPAGARSVTVSFDYLADSLDNAIAWATRDFVMFNGTNVFMYAEGRPLDFAATVTVRTGPTWKVATGMDPAAGGVGPAPRAYSAANFHDLVDMPFFVGRFDYDSARIADRWVRLATWPEGAVAGRARADLWEHHRQMFPPMIAVFQDAPYRTYTTMIVIDSTSGGGSALEHQNSHVGIYSPLALGSVLLPSITAHEIFHAWNVKRLRPADLWPYRYDRPQPTEWLWVSEGITDYYADLALVRGGIVDSSTFLALTQGKIQEVSATPPVALEDASLSTWIHPTDGTGYIYYPKGSLAGFLLDILIRDGSDNARSLDDVMRELYQQEYKRGSGFTAEDWWGAVRRAAGGKSFDDFHARYIDGREPFPYDSVLPLGGFVLRTDTLREPRLGVSTVQDTTAGGATRVVTIDPTSAAAAAGIEPGDILISVGEIPVSDATFGPRFRNRYQRAEGETIQIRLRRDGRELTLPMRIQLAIQLRQELIADPRASPKAARIRSGILRGGQ